MKSYFFGTSSISYSSESESESDFKPSIRYPPSSSSNLSKLSLFLDDELL